MSGNGMPRCRKKRAKCWATRPAWRSGRIRPTSIFLRTNKNDGLVDKDFLAKSRLVVQGFKDKALGHYRRDAPTASAIAESMCVAITAYHGFVLLAKDIKNAYFSGKSANREIYFDGVDSPDSVRVSFYGRGRPFTVLRKQLVYSGWP